MGLGCGEWHPWAPKFSISGVGCLPHTHLTIISREEFFAPSPIPPRRCRRETYVESLVFSRDRSAASLGGRSEGVRNRFGRQEWAREREGEWRRRRRSARRSKHVLGRLGLGYVSYFSGNKMNFWGSMGLAREGNILYWLGRVEGVDLSQTDK